MGEVQIVTVLEPSLSSSAMLEIADVQWQCHRKHLGLWTSITGPGHGWTVVCCLYTINFPYFCHSFCATSPSTYLRHWRFTPIYWHRWNKFMRCIIYITRQIYFTPIRFRRYNHSLSVLLQDLCLLETHIAVFQNLCATNKKGEELDCSFGHLTSNEISYKTNRTVSDRNEVFLQKD